jgi:NtrC-family two-component system sensor histidine kinase KinB
MLAIALAFGAVAIPTVYSLGRAVRETLYRNYISIEAAQHMHSALYKVQLALITGNLTSTLPIEREEFTHWINVELGDITEQGWAELAADIQRRGLQIFNELTAGTRPPNREQFDELHRRLDDLIAINQVAMFRADSRSARISSRLARELTAGLLLLLLLGLTLAETLGLKLSRPLEELANHLRSYSLQGPSARIGDQPLAELQAVASEFNRMADRLEQFERLNVDRLIYEKSKTEAIIESLEDGVVLIDPDGIVTHMNEVASIILGIEREDALGSSFDDLDTNSPHYVRIRSALRNTSRSTDSQRVEVELHVRGRAHTYLLKAVPLRQSDGGFFGTILILQDITYLRDQDRARTNLVATLSHELNTPLTSLGFCVELLLRRPDLGVEQRELLTSIQQDVARMRRLAADLMELARGQGVAITVQRVPVDLAEMVQAVIKGFGRQAEQKQVSLQVNLEPLTWRLRGDPLKLSWVISNLIANALRYTPAGGAIAVSLNKTSSGVRLCVSDTGPGIPPELRDRLFERFAQGPVNGSEPGAAGLGLAIVKEIVDAHGGRISVDSQAGQGTRFIVELPTLPEDKFNGKSAGC